MEEYIFCTTRKKYLKLFSRVSLNHKIKLIFWIIVLSVLSPFIVFFMFFDKSYKNKVKELIKEIKSLNKILFVNHTSWGFYDFKNKNITIDLETHNFGREGKTIQKIIETTIHEDLHKAFDDIGINKEKHHFGIERMGY